jgi:hypothetical protein
MATNRVIERDICRDVDHRENILEERGQDRTSRETTSFFRISFQGNGFGSDGQKGVANLLVAYFETDDGIFNG